MRTTGFSSAWRFPIPNACAPNLCVEVCIGDVTDDEEYEVWSSKPIASCLFRGLSKEEAFEAAKFASEVTIPGLINSIADNPICLLWDSYPEATWAIVQQRMASIYGVPFVVRWGQEPLAKV